MWFVLVVAIFNGFFPMIAREMRASGRPVEQIRRGETMAFIVINGIALSWSLYVFYAPWWKGKSRWEWFKAYLPRLLVPFIFVLVLRILTRWQDEASLSVLILLLLLVTGPVLLAAGLSVEIPRFLRLRRARSAPITSEASATGPTDPVSMTAPRNDATRAEPSHGTG